MSAILGAAEGPAVLVGLVGLVVAIEVVNRIVQTQQPPRTEKRLRVQEGIPRKSTPG